MMRISALCVVVAGGIACSPAFADIETTVKVKTYSISGDSGAALMDAMDRSGPRHGLLARAIAQTRYTVDWSLKWRQSGKTCSLHAAVASLFIDYRYPKLSGKAAPTLSRRWTRFMAGVRKHEETHGHIARQMVSAAYKSVSRVSFKNDPSCRKAQREVARRVNETYAAYEERQLDFDAKEHREGGTVDRLVMALVRGR